MTEPSSSLVGGRWGRAVHITAWVWTVTVFVLLWSPPPPPPENILWWWDKAVHFVLLGVFTGLWGWRGLPGSRLVPLGLLVGAVTEIGQGLMPWERNSSWGDFGADAAGVLVAWVVSRLLWPPWAGSRPRWW